MMYAAPIEVLIEQFESLPGIGRKTAERLAYHVIHMPKDKAENMAHAIIDAKERIHLCSCCFNLTDQDPCNICSNPKRDKSVICVVENPKDVTAIEKTKEFFGLYHVLHGAISPMDNISPGDLKIKELFSRLAAENIKEVIIATNPTIEGEATAMYLAKYIAPSGILVSRIASGVPIGGDLEYADEVTLGRAISGRLKLS